MCLIVDRTVSLTPQCMGCMHAVAAASEGEVTAQLASTLTAGDCRELLLFVMESAQRIALEPRPEVRTPVATIPLRHKTIPQAPADA